MQTPRMGVDAALTRCEQLLTTVDIPEPLDVDELCRRVAQRRGRPLVLLPQDTAQLGVPSGVWVPAEGRDEVYFDVLTTPAHRDAIVLHELGHILFGHPPLNVVEVIAARYPEVAGAAQRMLCRDGYGEQHELEAEMFATVVLDRYGDREGAERRTLASKLHSTFQA